MQNQVKKSRKKTILDESVTSLYMNLKQRTHSGTRTRKLLKRFSSETKQTNRNMYTENSIFCM